MNQNSNGTQTASDSVPHSKPISISTHHLRHRSTSFSSESSASPASSPPLVTPNVFTTRIPPVSSSPILYFLSQSPSKAPSTFPSRSFLPPPLLEDEVADEAPVPTHTRRASTSTTPRLQTQSAVLEPHHERGVNVLRRLSLSHRSKSPVTDIPQPAPPPPPPNSALPSSLYTNDIPFGRKPRRSATIAGQTRAHRAPSPMGERILKGHFDGFN